MNLFGGNGTPLQYSCLENPVDRGTWWAAVHGVAKNRTRLSNATFTFHFHALEKEMATHSSVLAWRIPGTGEPGGLLSVGSPSRTRLRRLSSSSSSRDPISLQGFPHSSGVKNLPAMKETQEMQLLSLGQEDPLEEEMAAHSSILAGKIP